MMKKINLSITILSVIEAICYFTPVCISREYWKYKESVVYHGVAVKESSSNINIFEVGGFWGKPLAILLFCITLFTAIVYLLKLMDYSLEGFPKAWTVSIVHTAVMVVFLIYTCTIAMVEEISFKFTYTIGWMFFVIIALNVISVILALLPKFGVVSIEDKRQENKETEKSVSSLDELLTYKELVDSGVLTQEEFDAKKKQILGM